MQHHQKNHSQGQEEEKKTQSKSGLEENPKQDGQKTTQNEDQNHQDELWQEVEQLKKETEIREAASAEQQTMGKNEDQINELKNALARAMADLQNFKRRSEEEKGSFVKFANAQLLRSLLPIFDNLSRSIQHLPHDLNENEWVKGILHIHADLFKTLEGLGIKKIVTVGEMFDAKRHEAVMMGPGEKNRILEEFEVGYEMNGEVIKPAKVKVGDGSGQE